MSDDSTSSEYCPVQRGRGRGKRARRGLAATPRVEIDPVVVVPLVVVPGEGGVVVTKDQIGKS